MSEYAPIGDLPHMSAALPPKPGADRDYWRGTQIARTPKRIAAAAVNYVAPAWAVYMIGEPYGGQHWFGSDVWWVLSLVAAMFVSGVNPWRFDVGRTLTGTTLVRAVYDFDGEPGLAKVGHVWRIVRFLCHPLDLLAGVPLGLILIFVRNDHRCVADLIAGTIVVNKPAYSFAPGELGNPERFPGLYRRDSGK